MELQWIIENGLPGDPSNNNRQKAEDYISQKISSAISYKIKFHKEWNIMTDLLNSDINKRLKLPQVYTLLVDNTLYKTYEDLISQMNFDNLPINIKSLFGENQEIISIYEQIIRAEDERLNGDNLRKKIYNAAHRKQISWLYMYVEDNFRNEAYGYNWDNQIKTQILDAKRVHFDPNTTKHDLSDCDYVIIEERFSYNNLVNKFGLETLTRLDIIPTGSSFESGNENNDSNEKENIKILYTYLFKEPNEEGKNNYYMAYMIDKKLIDTPKMLKPNRFPLVPYTKININEDSLIGTNELFLIKQDYISKVKVSSAVATSVLFDSGSQRIVNAQNVSPDSLKNMMYNPFAIIPLDNTNDVRNQIAAMEKKEPPQGAFTLPTQIDANAANVAGNSGIMGGATGSMQSGQAISQALTQGNQRQRTKMDNLKNFFFNYTNMLIDFMIEYYSLPRVHVIPKDKASQSILKMSAEQIQEQSQGFEQEQESQTDRNVKSILKKYKIKFKEDNDNIYIIAKMSDFKDIRKVISIDADKLSRMDESQTQRALEALYALDVQDPTGGRVLTKEMYVKMAPALRSVRNEIMTNYEIKKKQTESNKVSFISKFIMSQMMAMQARGMPMNLVNISQLTAQANQMWQTLPDDIKADGTSEQMDYVNSIKGNTGKGGVNNKVMKNN